MPNPRPMNPKFGVKVTGLDGKAYLVAHGAEANDPKPRFANLSWITGDQVYLLRVTPGIELMGVSTASSCKNMGRMKSAGASVVSRTMERIAGDWRLRRGRCMGNESEGLKLTGGR